MDYAHARHAGNAGDVFKHAALIALFDELLRDPAPLAYVETHAGDGSYRLASVGEWGDGIARVFAEAARGPRVARYAELVRTFSPPGATRPEVYPGSPLVAAKLLRAQDGARFFEIDAQAARLLRGNVRFEVREEDGLAALPGAVEGRAFALIDPPYSAKEEWSEAAKALAAARAANPAAVFCLWYPIKALTRPRALLAQLAKAGVHGVALELHWTPLRLARPRLNGAGLVLVNAPAAAPGAVAALSVELGPLLQTHGEWSAHQLGF